MEATIKIVRKWVQSYDLFGIEELLSIPPAVGVNLCSYRSIKKKYFECMLV